MIFSKRLKEYRAIKNWRQEDLAKFSGVSLPSIRRYETGKESITTRNLQKIADALGVDPSQLLDNQTNSGALMREIELNENNEAAPIGKKIRTIREENGITQKDFAKQFITRAREALDPSQSPMLAIPYFKNYYAAAGSGAINYDESPEIISFNAAFLESKLNTKNTAGIHIINSIGDSMYPTIKAGELLFIMPFANEYNRLKDGSIYIINTPQGVLVKRVRLHPVEQKITLVSDNKSVGEIELRGDELESLLIIGRVVGHFAFF